TVALLWNAAARLGPLGLLVDLGGFDHHGPPWSDLLLAALTLDIGSLPAEHDRRAAVPRTHGCFRFGSDYSTGVWISWRVDRVRQLFLAAGPAIRGGPPAVNNRINSKKRRSMKGSTIGFPVGTLLAATLALAQGSPGPSGMAPITPIKPPVD